LMNITAKVCGFNIDTWRSVLNGFPFLSCYNWNIVESGDKQPLQILAFIYAYVFYLKNVCYRKVWRYKIYNQKA
jgi:hypothetical protein